MVDQGEPPLELGDVVNINKARRNKEPVPHPESYLDDIHMEIGYGDRESIGGFPYVLLLVDRTTRNAWVYGLKTLSQDLIVQLSRHSKGFIFMPGLSPRCSTQTLMRSSLQAPLKRGSPQMNVR